MTLQIYNRLQEAQIEEALQIRRVVLLEGARQCGKSTLAKKMIHEKRKYLTLDSTLLQRAAENDPQGFVKNEGGTLIIDEIQRVPTLIQAIKLVVDEDNRPGQYLLTGSANIQSLPGVTESLAGRIHKIRLRPLTQGEIMGRQPQFLANAFAQKFPSPMDTFDRDDILSFSLRGGFPEAVRVLPTHRAGWHKDYINMLIDRDLKDIARIQRRRAMQELINVMAAWSSKFMDVSAIGSSLSITRPTLEIYLNALEALYVVESLAPWSNTDYDRVGKQSKVFFTDSGLMSSLLKWRFDQVRFDADRSGKAIETFIFNELAAQVDCGSGKYDLYHYRDRNQREIDFIIERDDGAILGIEVKAGSALGINDFKHLKWFKENLAGTREFIGIVLYTGEHVAPFGKNLWAIPMGQLW